ncbi:hypothetical protein PsorP6_015118 [Peronosclerospora sorghi]|uniref:Uncharacterized protein n=1 Tax=Peronosclerospora sorghi TaxID=230839 RepID=A0ACC0VTH1_9STRA|nr:hypothetical protein PsorP6_015118 [Peronosclerospora sorghi]
MQLYGTHWSNSSSSHSSHQSSNPMTTHSGEHRMRIFPRLDRHDDSSERSIAHSCRQEFDHDQLEPCVRRHWQYHWVSDPPQVPPISSPVASSPYISAYEEYEARFLEESPHQEYNHQIYGHTAQT